MGQVTRVPLLGGAYQSRSVIASAQRSIGLYPENNPEEGQAPVPVTTFLTPGLNLLATSPNVGEYRATYRATNGDLYVCVATQVYYVDQNFVFHLLGAIPYSTTPVSMSDNGIVVVIVDGTKIGYCIDITPTSISGNPVPRTWGTIGDPNYLGSSFVDYNTTYFVFNQPGTYNLYISLSEVSFAMLTSTVAGSAFDPLDIAAKSGSADDIQRVIVVYNTLWPIGVLTTEAWINSGAADFTFQPLPGVFIEHGCVAPFSVAANDRSAFWLSQDRQGQAIVLMIQGYNAVRISTHAIEAIFQAYPRLSDAIGFTFQLDGHIFYIITFPTANATWGFDIQTRQWFEWAYTDSNGNLNRHRGNCACFAYGYNIIGDWQNGNLYALSSSAYTDNGNPISRIRTFPHLIEDGSRVTYMSFIADIQVGTLAGSVAANPPMISLRWSDDRGATFGNAVEQSLGSEGQYLTSVKWNKLGMARDRVFELSWSAAMNTALQGAFVEIIKHRT